MAKERSVLWGGSWAHCEEFYNIECKWRVCVLFVLCYTLSKHLLSLNIWNKLNVNDTVGSKQMTTWYWRRLMVSSHGFPWFLLGQMKCGEDEEPSSMLLMSIQIIESENLWGGVFDCGGKSTILSVISQMLSTHSLRQGLLLNWYSPRRTPGSFLSPLPLPSPTSSPYLLLQV